MNTHTKEMRRVSKGTLAALVAFTVLLLPTVAGADASFGVMGGFTTTLLNFFSNSLIPFIFALALLVFIWGMFTYFILGGGDESKREQGKGLIIWAIIGFVLMITIFAIVNLLAGGITTGLGNTSPTDGVRYTPGVNLPAGTDPI